MAFYFDTSALSPLFIPDVHTPAVRRFLEGRAASPSLSGLTMIELSSLVSRQFRMRRIDANGAREALSRAASWTAQWCGRHDIEAADYSVGDDYVRRFDLGLRPADALHVAICRRLGLTLLTCDVAQAKAARELGVETIELGGSS